MDHENDAESAPEDELLERFLKMPNSSEKTFCNELLSTLSQYSYFKEFLSSIFTVSVLQTKSKQ